MGAVSKRGNSLIISMSGVADGGRSGWRARRVFCKRQRDGINKVHKS